MLEPKRGAVAYCSRGYLGLITSDGPQEITYPDGNKGNAWLGIRLTDKPPISGDDWKGPKGIGTPWSSRTPCVVGYIDEDFIIRATKDDLSVREKVFHAINTERDYQDAKWGGHKHSPEEWFVYIEDYVSEAKHILSRTDSQDADPRAVHIMRKVAAMAVAAMEQLGAPPRMIPTVKSGD